MPQITLRQIEAISAVMLRGTISGAAEHLGVSAPGISRIIKHAEESLGVRLFERRGGLFVPAVEASIVFDQIRSLNKGVANLQSALDSLHDGKDVRLAFASAPSVAQHIAPLVMKSLRGRYPDLFVDLNILKIEETLDYLLLERGEFVVMSSAIDNEGIQSTELGRGKLMVVIPKGHRLERRQQISVHDLVDEEIIGIDPDDPFGAIAARPFADAGITLKHSMRGRFAQTVATLVNHGLGVGLIDIFSISEHYHPNIVVRPLKEDAYVTIYAVSKKGRTLSPFVEYAIRRFTKELAIASGK